MKILKHILIGILIATIFSSCVKTINFSGEESNPKVVVNGILYADSTPIITVSKSAFFLNDIDTSYHGQDARVSLFINNTFVETLTYTKIVHDYGYGESVAQYFFVGNNILHENDKVRIEVEVPDFDKVYAEVIIPRRIPVKKLEATPFYTTLFDESPDQFHMENNEWINNYDSTISPNEIARADLDVTMTFDEPADEANFYNLTCTPGGSITSEDVAFGYMSDFLDIITDETNTYYFDYNNNPFNDIIINGQTHQLKFRIQYVHGQNDGLQPYTFAVNFMHTDKGYYNYFTTKNNNNDIGLVNLFMEPTQIYSNIEGGIGCIVTAAATIDSCSVNILNIGDILPPTSTK